MPITTHRINGATPARTFTFPGGDAHAVPGGADDGAEYAFVQGCDGNDLMQLAMWADACHRTGRECVAILPYLPGARQDRGIPLGAKVYADFVNSLKIDCVVCFDPHSDVMPALLERVTVVHLNDVPDVFAAMPVFVGVIAPDAGARKRAESVADLLHVPVYQALKHRDFATGKLSGSSCEPLPEAGSLLVVDDICDGGGTFVGLAEATGLPSERLALWVSHGIFSHGAKRLLDRFGLIATTDSHPGHTNISAQVTPLLTRLIDIAVTPPAASLARKV